MSNNLAKIAVLVVTTLICLFVSELFIRIIAPQQLLLLNMEEIFTPDHTGLRWRHVSNLATSVNTGNGHVMYYTDEHGFRISRPSGERDTTDTDISIIAIGDSFLEGLAVPNEDTFAQVLGSSLEGRMGVDVHVTNTGVGGYGPNQYYSTTKRVLSQERYDYGIVCLFIGNDIISYIDTSNTAAVVGTQINLRFPRSFAISEIGEAVLKPINEQLERRSHLFVFIKNRSKVLLAQLGLTGFYFPEVMWTRAARSDIWETTAEVCNAVADEFRQHDTPVLFVLLPASYQVHEASFDEHLRMFDIPRDSVDLDQANTLLAQHLDDLSVPYFDALTPMLETAQRDNLVMFGDPDDHFNAAGHRVVGELIAEVVFQNLNTNQVVPDTGVSTR
jgi:lysophospholipase L1-like esterase